MNERKMSLAEHYKSQVLRLGLGHTPLPAMAALEWDQHLNLIRYAGTKPPHSSWQKGSGGDRQLQYRRQGHAYDFVGPWMDEFSSRNR